MSVTARGSEGKPEHLTLAYKMFHDLTGGNLPSPSFTMPTSPSVTTNVELLEGLRVQSAFCSLSLGHLCLTAAEWKRDLLKLNRRGQSRTRKLKREFHNRIEGL